MFGNPGTTETKYPPQETNPTASTLQAFAARLGIDLRPTDPTRPSNRASSEQTVRRKSFSDYVSDEIATPTEAVRVPPDAVAHWLEQNREDVATIETLLVTGTPPTWEYHRNVNGETVSTANVTGLLELQRVLLAQSLAWASAGDARAERSLEASWQLNAALSRTPDVVRTMVALAIARLQVGALRKTPVRSENAWLDRLGGMDYRATLIDAFVIDYRFGQRIPSRDGAPGQGWLARARNSVGRPILRVDMAEYGIAMCLEFAAIRDAPLADHPPTPVLPHSGGVAQVLVSIAIPNIQNVFVRADRLAVDAELTARLLSLRQARREKGGGWPVRPEGLQESRFPGASWQYTVEPDGRATIAFSRDLASPYPPMITPLPLRFTLHGAAL
jgi:hypothetical protein